MDQPRLFYDDEFEALRRMIEGGEGYKKTAAHLRPDLKPESAYAWLKACVSEQGDQRLKFGQIVEAMKFNRRYDPLFYACDETYHDRPAQRAPEDRQAKLVEEFNRSAEQLMGIYKEIQQNGGTAALKAVK